MKISEVISAFHGQLEQRFSERGFKLRKADFEYVLKFGNIRSIYRVEIHTKTGWFLVTPGAYVGSTTINRKFNDILNRSIQVAGTTCGFGIGNECGHQRGRYIVDTASDVGRTADLVWLDFEEVAKPFFNRVTSLAAISEYINTVHEERSPAESVSDACMGIIAAKLVGDSRVRDLAARYYDFWSRAQSPELARDILTVQKALEGSTAIMEP